MSVKKKIQLNDWQGIKPYNKTAQTDLYYLEICNELHDRIYEHNFHIPLQDFVRGEGISLFCMFLTSYLEDIISGTEIWNSFTKKHKEIYGKSLPFFDTEKSYVEGEVNMQDVKFLIWYFINSVNKNVLLNPNDDFVQNLADKLYDILETEYEYAPENTQLRDTYQIDFNEDYYSARTLLDNILTKTYLFFPDTGLAILHQEAEIIQSGRRVETALNDNRDYFIHNAKTSLLALSAKEWAMAILGEESAMAKAFAEMSPRVHGSFLYLGQDENHLQLEHISTERKFDLLKKSFPKYKDLKENSIIFMGLVQWLGEWWFSGISIASDYNKEVVAKEKNNQFAKESLNFMEDQSLILNILNEHHEAFLTYNKGVPVAFLRKEEIDPYIDGYFKFFNETKELGTEEKEKAVKKYKPKAEKSEERPNNIMVLFHNPKSGFEVYANVESAFHIKQNKFLLKEKSDQDFYQIFLANFYTKEFVEYCIEVSKKKLEFFKNGYSDTDVDFLTRFFKPGIYHTRPRLTVLKNS